MRVLLAGDTHGNRDWCSLLSRNAQRFNCDLVFVVGDFGLWPGRWGQEFLDFLAEVYEQDGVPFGFLDGNHEDHDQLDPWRHGDVPWEIQPGLTYYPRGYRMDWDGLRVMTLGGAWSIDKAHRHEGLNWWPQEEITQGDVDRALDGPPVDVLLTHDMPADAEAVAALGFTMAEGGDWNRRAIAEVRHALKPKFLVHGHMHKKYDVTYDGTRVMGLDCDGGGPQAYYVFDTDAAYIDWAE